MSLAVLARTPGRRLRPGTQRALLAGASLLLHVAVLAPMILLAAGEEHAFPLQPQPPIIQLEIEPRPIPPEPRLRPPLPRSTPPVTASAVPIPTPATEPPRSTPIPAPQVPSQATPQPAPQSAPRALPQTAPVAPPRPTPAPTPAAAERASPAPSPALPIRPRKKDEDEARDGLPSPPAPRIAAPAPGAPPAAASGMEGVSDAWRVAPEGQAGRNARALRVSPAGCPAGEILTRGERMICDERFNARAAEGATRPITGSGNAERDARFAREGAREMQRYEAQRRPLSGGTGVVGPADCVGSNLGTGCAGAHLRDLPGVDMRQGARSTVNEGERRNSGFSASVGGLRVGGD